MFQVGDTGRAQGEVKDGYQRGRQLDSVAFAAGIQQRKQRRKRGRKPRQRRSNARRSQLSQRQRRAEYIEEATTLASSREAVENEELRYGERSILGGVELAGPIPISGRWTE